MSNFDSDMVAIFRTEAEELLGQIETITLALQPGQTDREPINHLFRAFHTIKGSGAMVGFDAIARFTHHVETALAKVRDGTVPVTQRLIELILGAKDHIVALMNSAPSEAGEALCAGFQGLLAGQQPAPRSPAVIPVLPPAVASISAQEPLQTFRVQFRPRTGAAASGGVDAAELVKKLQDLGECKIATAPGAGRYDWDFTLATRHGVNAIKDIFFFCENPAELEITPQGQPPAGVAIVESKATNPCTPSLPAPAPTVTRSASTKSDNSQLPVKASRAGSAEPSVRVPSAKLDRLVALVGELVINQSRFRQVAASADVPQLSAPVEELERLVTELRDNVLGIRMMPIGTTFGRFKRLVHDLSGELKKEVTLVTEGADTELDKTVLDKLGDPLVHLIRNSLDHGIESPEDRLRAGKPRMGTIRLVAAHRGANVVIEIQDDGKGLDVEAIRAKAIERKLITPDSSPTESEIYNLIFMPGFSTAKLVTNVSGRGVGMDAVKRQIDSLGGNVSIRSQRGVGTTISLTLPLTLAIIDGLLVEIAQDQYIVPMAAVTENVELHRRERLQQNGRNLINVRGDLVSYIRLRELFGTATRELDLEKVVIVKHGEERVGLVVDRVLGSHQTVIQSLGRFYRNLELVSGSTIMGDGRVALIFDLSGLVRLAAHRREGGESTVSAGIADSLAVNPKPGSPVAVSA